MVVTETTGETKSKEVTTKAIWNFTDEMWNKYLESGLSLSDFIDKTAGKKKTGDISTTIDAPGGTPLHTPEASSHTITPVLNDSLSQDETKINEGVSQSGEVEQAIPLPIAGQETADSAVARSNGDAEPVRAGKNTVIQRPYQGETPQNRANAQYQAVTVEDAGLKTAQARIEQARAESGGEKIKSSLKRIYREAVGNLFNGRTVAVDGVEFNGWPYEVTLNKNVIDKVISDKNLSAEKLAVFDVIDDVVQNAEYLGSGEYVPHGNHIKEVIRYDYFETPMEINGTPYTVSFDVEVLPGRNNYRTHRVINNLELHPVSGETRSSTGLHKQSTAPNEQGGQALSAVRTAYSEADTGPAPAAAERFSLPDSNNNIPAERKTVNGVPLPIAGGATVQSEGSRQARQRALETGTVSEELLDYTERMAQRSGRQLEYVFEPDSQIGGSVDDTKVTINLANPDHAFSTAVHEVGHTMKIGSPQQWASFEQAMLRLADSSPEMESIARGVVDAYLSENSRGLRSMQTEDGSLNEAALNEEISLKLAEEIVKDPARITKAVEQDRGLIGKLLDFVRGLKNQTMIRFGKSESAMLDEAERTLVNLLRGRGVSLTSGTAMLDKEQILTGWSWLRCRRHRSWKKWARPRRRYGEKQDGSGVRMDSGAWRWTTARRGICQNRQSAGRRHGMDRLRWATCSSTRNWNG